MGTNLSEFVATVWLKILAILAMSKCDDSKVGRFQIEDHPVLRPIYSPSRPITHLTKGRVGMTS